MSGRFEGRVALVTGSSRGIGLASARRLAAGGARVMLNSRDADEIAAAEAELAGEGLDVASVVGSVVDEGGSRAIVDATVERYGPIGLLVNTVGVNASFGPLIGADRSRVARTMLGNVLPTLDLLEAAIATGTGAGSAFVAVSTIGSRQVQPNLGVYGAAKSGLESIVRTLARELGPSGIRVNAVAPGLVKTAMSSVLWEGERAEHEAALLPLQRLGEPDDIAAAVEFLLADDAGWLTGHTIDVDGGRLLVGDEPFDLIGKFQSVKQETP